MFSSTTRGRGIDFYLKDFIVRMRDAHTSMEKDKGKELREESLEKGEPRSQKRGTYVGTIVGGRTLVGRSKRSIKTYGRNAVKSEKVNMSHGGSPLLITQSIPIIFTEQDSNNIVCPHDNALEITLKVTVDKVA